MPLFILLQSLDAFVNRRSYPSSFRPEPFLETPYHSFDQGNPVTGQQADQLSFAFVRDTASQGGVNVGNDPAGFYGIVFQSKAQGLDTAMANRLAPRIF
jgi:hypothetical protein